MTAEALVLASEVEWCRQFDLEIRQLRAAGDRLVAEMDAHYAGQAPMCGAERHLILAALRQRVACRIALRSATN